jgi:hypothetical protein
VSHPPIVFSALDANAVPGMALDNAQPDSSAHIVVIEDCFEHLERTENHVLVCKLLFSYLAFGTTHATRKSLVCK